MARYSRQDLRAMVEPDRVHRSVYNDPEIFELEMERIFNKVWTYVGHESQVKTPGEFWTVFVGRQPMIMIRHDDGKIHVLYNRCPHRGNLLIGQRHGRIDKSIVCSYHSWQFHSDGTAKAIPIPRGYDGTKLDITSAACNIKRAPRVESYRGFVFASLADSGPSLLEWLGASKVAFDQMCDRSPEGEVEVVPTCFRIMQKSNWKFFVENQLDVAHAVITHESTGRAAADVEEGVKERMGSAPIDYHFLSGFVLPLSLYDKMTTVNYPAGHSLLEGYMSLRPQDKDSLEYEAIMKKKYGEARANEILDGNLHHVICYPVLSVQPPLQQLRSIRPIGPDRTLTEIWHFRLKGAPEGMYRRALGYFQLVNSPSTTINADDLDNWWRCQQGLNATGKDWVSFHRNAGQDKHVNGVTTSITGMSELPMRHMFEAWTSYMNGEIAR